jgi:hypothetical protein
MVIVKGRALRRPPRGLFAIDIEKVMVSRLPSSATRRELSKVASG